MRLIVLGSSPVKPNPGAAQSGFLLEAGPRRFLVDCGSGVLAQLLRHSEIETLDGVFLSHDHPDHCLDLIHLRQSLAHAPGPGRDEGLPVFAPLETIETMRALGSVFGSSEFWEPWVDWRAVAAGDRLDFDDLHVSFHRSRHYRPCLAARFERAGRSFVYGADGGPDPGMAEFARGADLLVSEATLDRREGHEQAWGHQSAAEAGALAASGGVGRLLLTHYFATFGTQRLLDAARAACDLPVGLAREGEVHDV